MFQSSHTTSIFAVGEVDPQSSERKEVKRRTDICFAATSYKCLNDELTSSELTALSCKQTYSEVPLLVFSFLLADGWWGVGADFTLDLLSFPLPLICILVVISVQLVHR